MKRKNPAAVALGRKGGIKGGPARAAAMTSEQRSEAARTAVNARWKRRQRKMDIKEVVDIMAGCKDDPLATQYWSGYKAALLEREKPAPAKDVKELQEEIKNLSSQLEISIIREKGANERAMMLLKSKTYWMEKYLETPMAVGTGDKMRITVELMRQWLKENDGYSEVCVVVNIQKENDGVKTIWLKPVGEP